jgi:hypothetical protein
MNPGYWRRATVTLLLFAATLLGSCESSSGIGFSVSLPANYGSMELGLATTDWVGGPSW